MYIGLTLSAMPDVHLAWVPKGTRQPYDPSRLALIPLYVDGTILYIHVCVCMCVYIYIYMCVCVCT